jgi:hypothetical protein
LYFFSLPQGLFRLIFRTLHEGIAIAAATALIACPRAFGDAALVVGMRVGDA